MKYTSLLLCVFAIAGCSEQNPSSTTQENTPAENTTMNKNMPGGWTETPVTIQATQALDFVLNQMNSGAKLERIIKVQTQVVNGVNYAIDFKLDNGQVWNTVVYRDTSGKLTMSQPAKHGSSNVGIK